MSALHTIVAGDGVFNLNLGELGLLNSVLGKKFVLLLVGENEVLGNKFVLSDVDQELLLVEELDFARLEVLQFLDKEDDYI